MKVLYIIFILSVFVLKCSAQQIAKEKCDLYSNVPMNSKFGHMVWIRNVAQVVHIGCIGVLISEQFVITLRSCVADMKIHESEVLFDENDKSIIIEVINHNYWSGDSIYYNIALLKLEKPVTLDSNHRPACLWQTNFINETLGSAMKWETSKWIRDYQIENYRIFDDSKCHSFHPNINISHTCTEPIDKEKNSKFIPTLGSPLQARYDKNYYVIGLFAYHFGNTDPYISVFTRLSIYINWIEYHVWGIKVQNNDLIYSDCGEVKIKSKPLQTFAFPSFHGQFPWHVAINKRERFGLKEYICGGSLITSRVVLTAAHCVALPHGTIAPELLTVELGKFELDIAGLELRVYEVYVYHDFIYEYLENDIALLKLENSVTFTNFIQPVCFSFKEDIYKTNIGTVPGWGENERKTHSNKLTKATFPIVSNSYCRQSNRDFFSKYLHGKAFCAGYKNGTNVCSGDSGGGMVFDVSGKWFIRGIVSLGVSLKSELRCDITELVIFTDAIKYYGWIKDYINNLN